ncbi:hypothetical protein ANN_05745 [Periplaneta americana]|uniref:Uncharacterized protein n=1 Tax=Periplaneta americana TaxID=6978 RepID=A0ABQ8TDD9_PERAM|nr:hypothetical protein ANN_05745 [Periplaneta americana]
MADLCEGGNEPAGSLKAICAVQRSARSESPSFTTIQKNRNREGDLVKRWNLVSSGFVFQPPLSQFMQSCKTLFRIDGIVDCEIAFCREETEVSTIEGFESTHESKSSENKLHPLFLHYKETNGKIIQRVEITRIPLQAYMKFNWNEEHVMPESKINFSMNNDNDKEENRKHRLLPPPRLEFDDTGVKHKSLY